MINFSCEQCFCINLWWASHFNNCTLLYCHQAVEILQSLTSLFLCKHLHFVCNLFQHCEDVWCVFHFLLVWFEKPGCVCIIYRLNSAFISLTAKLRTDFRCGCTCGRGFFELPNITKNADRNMVPASQCTYAYIFVHFVSFISVRRHWVKSFRLTIGDKLIAPECYAWCIYINVFLTHSFHCKCKSYYCSLQLSTIMATVVAFIFFFFPA